MLISYRALRTKLKNQETCGVLADAPLYCCHTMYCRTATHISFLYRCHSSSVSKSRRVLLLISASSSGAASSSLSTTSAPKPA